MFADLFHILLPAMEFIHYKCGRSVQILYLSILIDNMVIFWFLLVTNTPAFDICYNIEVLEKSYTKYKTKKKFCNFWLLRHKLFVKANSSVLSVNIKWHLSLLPEWIRTARIKRRGAAKAADAQEKASFSAFILGLTFTVFPKQLAWFVHSEHVPQLRVLPFFPRLGNAHA